MPREGLKCIKGVKTDTCIGAGVSRERKEAGDEFKLLLPSTKQPGDFTNCDLGRPYEKGTSDKKVVNDFIAEAVAKKNSKADNILGDFCRII